MPGDLHDDGFRHPRLSHIGVEAMPGIVENKSVFCAPSIGYPGCSACIPQCSPDVLNGFPFEEKNMIFVDLLAMDRLRNLL